MDSTSSSKKSALWFATQVLSYQKEFVFLFHSIITTVIFQQEKLKIKKIDAIQKNTHIRVSALG